MSVATRGGKKGPRCPAAAGWVGIVAPDDRGGSLPLIGGTSKLRLIAHCCQYFASSLADMKPTSSWWIFSFASESACPSSVVGNASAGNTGLMAKGFVEPPPYESGLGSAGSGCETFWYLLAQSARAGSEVCPPPAAAAAFATPSSVSSQNESGECVELVTSSNGLFFFLLPPSVGGFWGSIAAVLPPGNSAVNVAVAVGERGGRRVA